MVRADKSGSGVMFSIDTETGFPDMIIINAAWGLGENVVQGTVTPDEYRVFKPLLEDPSLRPLVEKTLGTKERKLIYTKGGTKTTHNVDTTQGERNSFVLDEDEILQLARWAKDIERDRFHFLEPGPGPGSQKAGCQDGAKIGKSAVFPGCSGEPYGFLRKQVHPWCIYITARVPAREAIYLPRLYRALYRNMVSTSPMCSLPKC
ncbi:MAG: PEP/pyruvate-binding domain-containing protein [Desulfohalobiaceae bacterium]